MPERHDIRMWIFHQLSHDLKFTILEALVLQDLLDGYNFTGLYHLRLEYYPEGAITNYPLRRVGDVLLRNACVAPIPTSTSRSSSRTCTTTSAAPWIRAHGCSSCGCCCGWC